MATTADPTPAPGGDPEPSTVRVRDVRDAGTRVEHELRRLLGPSRTMTTALDTSDPERPRFTVTLDAYACHDLADVLKRVGP